MLRSPFVLSPIIPITVEALAPNDPRVEHKKLCVEEGITYHYMVANPPTKPSATVLLLHGWPDLGMGWRYQVPCLLSLNQQVLIPDLLGYGRTSAPSSPSTYTLKRMASHIAALIRTTTDTPGAFLAWRIALYFPELVRGLVSFCIPFFPPLPFVVPLEQFVRQFPDFAYQLQLAGLYAEAAASRSPAHLRGFLRSMFGGVTSGGEPGFDVRVGVIAERLPQFGPSPLVEEEILDFYEYSRTGLHGPMNWYRTRILNGEDEVHLAEAQSTFALAIPAMIVMAGQDPALPPRLLDGQDAFFPAGLQTRVIPDASHWVLIHHPAEANNCISEFLANVLDSTVDIDLPRKPPASAPVPSSSQF
ncbi:alpha/beta hydrolase [Aspergillus brunneoviolaceus CBS 621.78]|uniref:Alpha/beta-hydrolase n=1 Tax=Aspergillus brunneoviolaceus CBS 621.78 TaxID=1450534 RepID=A0ACD1FZH6_9EURO|nr:alpha/beta-hydrolase [Aspergillus brunneoviolaceus CBS 621.78]RAH42316.1 alpha/beta-hydrolase [Aspergillus brunneoviolaceus CBS 621.78]